MAKGYTRSSHMSGGYPECGTKLYGENHSGSGGSGPSHVQVLNSGKSGKAAHLPRAGAGIQVFPVRSKPQNRGGHRIGSK